MEKIISKSQFKPKALKYFRDVERTGRPIIISDHGKPVLKIIPYEADPEEVMRSLRNSVVKYDDPTEPVGKDAWETLKS